MALTIITAAVDEVVEPRLGVHVVVVGVHERQVDDFRSWQHVFVAFFRVTIDVVFRQRRVADFVIRLGLD